MTTFKAPRANLLTATGFGCLVKEIGRIAMPKGPKGERRPADAIGNAVMIARIATGEIQDNKKSGRVKSGQAGAKARAQNLTSEQRSDIAKKAANARWS
jgi:hypothetical protein